MRKRLTYEESFRLLQREGRIPPGEVPQLPYDLPRHGDERWGIRLFQMMIADANLNSLSLPRTFISRSEFRATSFQNTDLSESTVNWNDFIDVDFREADLTRCDLRGCLFDGVKFDRASLAGADFRYCGFKNCNFSNADLADAKLTRKVGVALTLSIDQQNVIDWQLEDGDEPPEG